MNLAIIILSFLLQQSLSFDIPYIGCDSDLTINNDDYNVTYSYPMGDAYPTDAHYDDFGNLFYVESGRNTKGFYFDVKMIDFESVTPHKVVGLPDGVSYSVAVDKKNANVYFGTGQGIYSFNYDTKTATLISKSDLKLNMIFVDKDGNKYITESNNGVEELYLLDGVKKIRFQTLEALNELAIDDRNNFFYIKEEKLFVLKSTLSTPVWLGNVSYDGIAQISIHKQNVYVASETLLYCHSNEEGNLRLVQNIPGKVTAIAFDHFGDFVLGIQGKLLKYKKNECYFRKNNVTN